MSWLSSILKPSNAAQQSVLDTAAYQKKLEDDRQGRVRDGQAGIDTAFAQFDPSYYDKFKTDYNAFYTPDVNRQYALAKDKLTAVLAGRGTLESTAGAAKFGELEGTRANTLADVGNKAQDAANELRSKVESAKTNLYNINTSVADPAAMASQASGSAASIAAPQSLSPLGSVFANTLNAFGTYNKADANSMNPSLAWNQGYSTPSGNGSGRVIG